MLLLWEEKLSFSIFFFVLQIKLISWLAKSIDCKQQLWKSKGFSFWVSSLHLMFCCLCTCFSLRKLGVKFQMETKLLVVNMGNWAFIARWKIHHICIQILLVSHCAVMLPFQEPIAVYQCLLVYIWRFLNCFFLEKNYDQIVLFLLSFPPPLSPCFSRV